jgi:hypothetical protein
MLYLLRSRNNFALRCPARLSKTATTETLMGYPMNMAVNWIELALKMAATARARVAADRKRLREILAERQRKQPPAQSSSRSQ